MKAQLQIGNEMREGFWTTLRSADDFWVMWDFKVYGEQVNIYGGRNISDTEEQALEHFKSIGGVIFQDAA